MAPGVLLSCAYLDDVGLFDERYFLYYEDTDLSWRGQSRGWRYRYVPDAIERHVHAASSVEGSPMFEFFVARNRLIMLAKHAPPSVAFGAAIRFVRSTAGAARHDVVKPVLAGRRPETARVRLRARSFAGFVALLPGIVSERRSRSHRPLAEPPGVKPAHR